MTATNQQILDAFCEINGTGHEWKADGGNQDEWKFALGYFTLGWRTGEKLEAARLEGIAHEHHQMVRLLADLGDFLDDLNLDSSHAEDREAYREAWISWRRRYAEIQNARRRRLAAGMKRSCDNAIHAAEGGDIICPDCGEAV